MVSFDYIEKDDESVWVQSPVSRSSLTTLGIQAFFRNGMGKAAFFASPSLWAQLKRENETKVLVKRLDGDYDDLELE